MLKKESGILNLAWSNSGSHNKSLDTGQYVVHLDGFDATAKQVHEWKKKKKLVTAYLSIGSLENWRPDRHDFPSDTIGKDYNGWAGEKWLNVSVWKKLIPVMTKRFEMVKSKGFDGFELDNTELHHHDPKATRQHGIDYTIWIATTAHKMGLLVFWKNSLDLIKDVVNYFDGVINEEAIHYNETGPLKLFYEQNKPVWVFEYTKLKHSIPSYISHVYLDIKYKGWVVQ